MVRKSACINKAVTLALLGGLMATALPASHAQTHMHHMQMQGSGVTVRQQQAYVIPAGSVLSLRETTFAGAVGEQFVAQLANPIRSGGQILIPTGSTVRGQVVSADPAGNVRGIRLQNIALATGQQVAFDTSITTAMPVTVAAVREEPLAGRVTTVGEGITTLYPRVTIGPEGLGPGGRILASTAGGALFGAATGTLTGLTIGAVDGAMSAGTGAARGVGFGAAYGAGFGLLGGLISAATAPTPVAVTSTAPVTAMEPSGRIMNVRLDQPVTIHM